MLTLTRRQLTAICSGFNKIVTNTAIPILQHVLAHRGGIVATNLDETLEYRLEGPQEPFLLAYADLKRLSKGLSKSGVVTLSRGDHCVEACVDDGQRITQSLDTLCVDEFPRDTPDGDFKDMDIAAFLDGFRQASRAASKDSSRMALNGVHLDPGGACMVGTDGHRLMKVPSCTTFPEAVTIPATKLLTSSVLSGEARGAVTDTQLLLHAGPWLYSTKLIDLAYPKYANVIPSRENTSCIDLGDFDPKALVRAIRQFPDTGRGLYVYADSAKAAILADDTGSGFVALELQGATAELEDPVSIAFDRRYFIDGILSGFRTLAITDAYKPASFFCDEACYILMPLRENPTKAITAWMHRSLTPEPEVPMPPEPDPEPDPAPAADTSSTGDPKPELTVLPDPLDELLEAIHVAETTLKESSSRLREVKRGVKSFTRDARRERRDHAAKLKEIQAARAAIAKLQAVNF